MFVVEALYQASAQPATLLGEQPGFDQREWDIFCKTQLVLIKSNFVLTAALRDPKVANLPLVAAQEDAVEWLADQLEIEFLLNSEVLSIRMRGTDGQIPDLRQLVDAVCEAYSDEVVDADEQRREVIRDASARTAGKLRNEIADKMEARRRATAEFGDDDDETTFFESEIEVLTDIWRNLIQSVEYDDVEAAAPPRIRQLQPATVRPE
jgi:hypothetical protein